MSDNALILDSCLVALARDEGKLQDLSSLQQFFQPWSQQIAGYAENSLLYLKKNLIKILGTVVDSSLGKLTKTERKAIIKTGRVSKKLKYVDNSIVVKET